MARAVVGEPQPVHQQLEHLAAREVAAERVEPRVALERLDQRAQALEKRVSAEVVESGLATGSGQQAPLVETRQREARAHEAPAQAVDDPHR